jgi:hypothetical protein
MAPIWTRAALLIFIASVGCYPPTPPVPPDNTCPERVREDDFRTALFTVYKAALSPFPEKSEPIPGLDQAANTIRCGVSWYGEFWRRLALARLAARSTTDPYIVRAARELLGSNLVGILATLQDKLAGICGVKERFAAAYPIVVPLESKGQPGMPTCASTPPDTTSDAQGWLATASSSVWLRTSLSQVAQTVDPQAWSKGCAHLVFLDTHVAKHKTGGAFDVDTTTCTAKAGTPYTLGTKWHDDLFEYFVPPTYVTSFFKNILTIKVLQAPPDPAYKMTYEYNTGLQAQAGGAPALACGTSGLYLDDGGVTALDAGSGWTYVATSKNVAFSDIWPDPPGMATKGSVALHALMDMMPWLVCCPPDFP